MGEICIGKMVLGMVETNCYFLYDEDSKKAVVVDPAKDGIYDKLSDNGLTVEAIILTHGHFDHIMGVNELREKSGALVYALQAENNLLKDPKLNASLQIRRTYTVDADRFLNDGQEIELAGITFKVYSTPGHTAGSCCYYVPAKNWLISGDTLFRGSIGRSDLPTGSESEILKSVNKLLDSSDFDEDTKVYPGHGEPSSIGFEREYNPFRS